MTALGHVLLVLASSGLLAAGLVADASAARSVEQVYPTSRGDWRTAQPMPPGGPDDGGLPAGMRVAGIVLAGIALGAAFRWWGLLGAAVFGLSIWRVAHHEPGETEPWFGGLVAAVFAGLWVVVGVALRSAIRWVRRPPAPD